MVTEGTSAFGTIEGFVTDDQEKVVARGNKVVDRKRHERQSASQVRRDTMWSRDADVDMNSLL